MAEYGIDQISDALTKVLGVRIRNDIRTAYPEIDGVAWDGFMAKLVSLAWLPKDWVETVNAARAQYPAHLIHVAWPTNTQTGALLPNAPAFLDSPAKVAVWQGMSRAQMDMVNAFGGRKLEEGRAIMAAANADAAFWDRAYAIAVTLRDLPGTAIRGTLDTIGATLRLAFGSWVLWALLGAVVVAGVGFLWSKGRK